MSSPSPTDTSGSSKPYVRPSVGRPKLNLKPTFAELEEKTEPPKATDTPWWRFTIDTGTSRVWGGQEKQSTDQLGPESEFTKRAGVSSAHQSHTPGWEDPWQPYVSLSANPFDNIDHPFAAGLDDTHLANSEDPHTKSWWSDFTQFLLLSPWAPFWLRTLNLLFTTTTLGLASRIWHLEHASHTIGIIGTSTICALVFGCLTVVHIFIALWLEYFGAPIGVWSVGRKMFHTLSELLFIAIWSAELSLAFDDYFTSVAACTRWTPYARFRANPDYVDSNPPAAICRLQAGLVAMVTVSLFLYQAVLIVSLFRIYVKVSRPTR